MGQVYPVQTGSSVWYVIRSTLDSIIGIVGKLAEKFPVGQEFCIFQGEKLIATRNTYWRSPGEKPSRRDRKRSPHYAHREARDPLLLHHRRADRIRGDGARLRCQLREHPRTD